MVKKTKPGKRKKPVRTKIPKVKVYQGWDAIHADRGPDEIIANLEELAMVVESILEASISDIEDLVIDADSMIESIKDSVEALDED
jgi:hypothetical protein